MKLFSIIISLIIALSLPMQAFAVTYDVDGEPDELQQKVEETAAVYDEALVRLSELESKKREKERQIERLEKEIPVQKERSQNSVAEIYRMQSSGYSLLSVLLSSTSFESLVASLEYAERYQSSIYGEITRLEEMRVELEAAQKTLEQSIVAATALKEAAETSLVQAQKAREEARARAEAQRKKEEEAAKAARAAKKAAKKNNNSGAELPPPNLSKVDWSKDKVAFVKQWAPRINDYLNGSPLDGYGETFASAAWDNGVDPRWSPAISHVESSKGANCFRSHNAWGWGDKSWPDWETAINAHVNGLARIYGYTISEAAAKKYCPPSWQSWYKKNIAEMAKI